ncbi:class F sortase [Amycolatopsis nigrescens]|uniref:class F sortase n=1 Tax=Amycolatopsis nigrescens TaxID=381445 RepID=UPI000376916F|nr:class F sortase [Amycolatopsis nigrescens]
MKFRLVVAAGIAAATVVLIVLFLQPSPVGPAASPPPAAVLAPAPVPASGDPTAPPSPQPVPPPPPAQTRPPVPIDAAVLPPSKPGTLEVPAIGVRTGPIIDLGLNPDRSLQVPGDAKTTGWYTLGPTPGETGPAVLAGHVDYQHVPGVFHRLRELRPGAEAIVHRGDGSIAVFTVYRVDSYAKSAFPTDAVYGNTAAPELRLITCGGAYDPAARRYLDNVVAYARFSRAYRL